MLSQLSNSAQEFLHRFPTESLEFLPQRNVCDGCFLEINHLFRAITQINKPINAANSCASNGHRQYFCWCRYIGWVVAWTINVQVYVNGFFEEFLEASCKHLPVPWSRIVLAKHHNVEAVSKFGEVIEVYAITFIVN